MAHNETEMTLVMRSVKHEADENKKWLKIRVRSFSSKKHGNAWCAKNLPEGRRKQKSRTHKNTFSSARQKWNKCKTKAAYTQSLGNWQPMVQKKRENQNFGDGKVTEKSNDKNFQHHFGKSETIISSIRAM